jgi:hypothetical protein
MYIYEVTHLPSYPYLRPRVDGWGSEMDKPETDCRKLTQTVAAVLDNDNLKRLFVSTQQNNLELCIELAVRR